MPTGPRLFRVNPTTRESTSLREVDFAQLGLRERSDIQEWVANHPDILGDDLLIVAKEFSDFDRTRERPDLLAIDSEGALVVIELKRDDSGADAYWQAIKYASYFRHAIPKNIVDMLADYERISQEDAKARLQEHLKSGDLESLNGEQRIILASHRFARQATSAVIWLNDKFAGGTRITCIQLTPYHDKISKALFLQANTIIPLPGEKDLVMQVGSKNITVGRTSTFAENLSRTYARNSSDEVSEFFVSRVRKLVLNDLASDVKPDINSRWAGDDRGYYRYYRFWYKRPPWKNWGFSHSAKLYSASEGDGQWKVQVGLDFWGGHPELKKKIVEVTVHEDQVFDEGAIRVEHTSNELDDDFANAIAGTFRQFIRTVTPLVDAFMEEEANQEDA